MPELERNVRNYSMHVADATLEANVEFQGRSGMQPKVIRTSTGHCCDWCSRLAGTYSYPNVPRNVYQRHRDCRCTVDYALGDRSGRRQNVHSKKWTTAEERAKIESRKAAGAHPSAKGKNVFFKGFTQINLKKHWNKHGGEYPDLLSQKAYNKYALDLIQQPVSDDVIGYRTKNGAVVRYRISTNDYVVGYPETGISTMYKPKNDPEKGLKYVLSKMEQEGITDD